MVVTPLARGGGGVRPAASQRRARRHMVTVLVAGLAATLCAPVAWVAEPVGASAPPVCAARQAGDPMWVTAECVDPDFDEPVIDATQDLDAPVPHRRVSGHFEGTNVRFNIYLPPRRQWDGRFFQLVYPLQDENASDETIAFGADSGAYTVQTNGGGGYRADAAAAKFSRTVAADHYGRRARRAHGYIYGASGGSYQTIGAIENTTGVWAGAVPMVMGAPTSIPNNFMVRALARLVLADDAERIADAVAPGGTGDPYAGLDELERAMLREVTRMGVPLRAWEDPRYLLGLDDPQGLLGLGRLVRAVDPTYVDDFWTAPGYLGTEASPLGDLVRAALVDDVATIARIDRDAAGTPTALGLDDVPAIPSTTGLDHTVLGPDGTTSLGTLSGSLDPATATLRIGPGNSPEVLAALAEGGQVRIDNRWFLALHAYHRHQVPSAPGFPAWDQFRGPDGRPTLPQRPVEVGPGISSQVSGGGTHTGDIQGKVIVVQNLVDADAFPWHADWYRQRVEGALGRRGADANFRVWFNDNADHHLGQVDGPRANRLVGYTGIVQQALRDVAAWAEDGIAPPRSTRYDVDESQVDVPDEAARRRGIQPVVDLTADGTDRIEVAAGQPVTLRARVEVPPGAGAITGTEWDIEGTGSYTATPVRHPRRTLTVEATFTYAEPGTYLPALRATSRRDGDHETPFARVQNLDRVRVVVR